LAARKEHLVNSCVVTVIVPMVIDTVGVKTDRPLAMLDMYGTPYTRALRGWRRNRRVSRNAPIGGLRSQLRVDLGCLDSPLLGWSTIRGLPRQLHQHPHPAARPGESVRSRDAPPHPAPTFTCPHVLASLTDCSPSDSPTDTGRPIPARLSHPVGLRADQAIAPDEAGGSLTGNHR
jgi:hypothetical protein